MGTKIKFSCESLAEVIPLEMWDGGLLAAWSFLLDFRHLTDGHVGIIFLTSEFTLLLGEKVSILGGKSKTKYNAEKFIVLKKIGGNM